MQIAYSTDVKQLAFEAQAATFQLLAAARGAIHGCDIVETAGFTTTLKFYDADTDAEMVTANLKKAVVVAAGESVHVDFVPGSGGRASINFFSGCRVSIGGGGTVDVVAHFTEKRTRR